MHRTSWLLLFLVSCARAPLVPDGQPFEPQEGPRIGGALVTRESVTGLGARLARSPQGGRGTFAFHVVDVAWSDSGMRGQVDGAPAWLEVGAAGRVVGAIAHERVELDAEGGGWRGVVGRCRYALVPVDSGLVGRSSCDSPTQGDLQIAFSGELPALSAGERLTYLALLLLSEQGQGRAERGLVPAGRPPNDLRATMTSAR